MLQARWCCRADSAVRRSAARRAGEQAQAAATFRDLLTEATQHAFLLQSMQRDWVL